MSVYIRRSVWGKRWVIPLASAPPDSTRLPPSIPKSRLSEAASGCIAEDPPHATSSSLAYHPHTHPRFDEARCGSKSPTCCLLIFYVPLDDILSLALCRSRTQNAAGLVDSESRCVRSYTCKLSGSIKVIKTTSVVHPNPRPSIRPHPPVRQSMPFKCHPNPDDKRADSQIPRICVRSGGPGSPRASDHDVVKIMSSETRLNNSLLPASR